MSASHLTAERTAFLAAARDDVVLFATAVGLPPLGWQLDVLRTLAGVSAKNRSRFAPFLGKHLSAPRRRSGQPSRSVISGGGATKSARVYHASVATGETQTGTPLDARLYARLLSVPVNNPGPIFRGLRDRASGRWR